MGQGGEFDRVGPEPVEQKDDRHWMPGAVRTGHAEPIGAGDGPRGRGSVLGGSGRNRTGGRLVVRNLRMGIQPDTTEVPVELAGRSGSVTRR